MDPLLPTCSRCGTSSPPTESGLCSNPRCRSFRAGHQLSRKYVLDENDVRAKEARYVRDYGAANEDVRDACRLLAETVCALKKARKGSAEHQRLLAARMSLRAELEAGRVDRPSPAQDLTLDELIARTAETLRGLCQLRDASPPPVAAETPFDSSPTAAWTTSDPGLGPALAVPAPGEGVSLAPARKPAPPAGPTVEPEPDSEPAPDSGPDNVVEHLSAETLPYGSEEREQATAALWRQFGIRPPRY